MTDINCSNTSIYMVSILMLTQNKLYFCERWRYVFLKIRFYKNFQQTRQHPVGEIQCMFTYVVHVFTYIVHVYLWAKPDQTPHNCICFPNLYLIFFIPCQNCRLYGRLEITSTLIRFMVSIHSQVMIKDCKVSPVTFLIETQHLNKGTGWLLLRQHHVFRWGFILIYVLLNQIKTIMCKYRRIMDSRK